LKNREIFHPFTSPVANLPVVARCAGVGMGSLLKGQLRVEEFRKSGREGGGVTFYPWRDFRDVLFVTRVGNKEIGIVI
jgi:hypothetical protein